MIGLNNITVVFGENTSTERIALSNIHLEINASDFVMVLGTNGAGKSTLLNVITGDVQPIEGNILIDDNNVTMLSVSERSPWISRVFQDPFKGTCAQLTVEENLSLAFKRGQRRYLSWASKKSRRDFFKTRLTELNIGLEKRLSDSMRSLSGGQRQAVGLVMATLNTPKIILLDEHTSALDPKMSELVMHLTHQLILKNNLTALMVTHDLDEALNYGNRLIVLREGRIFKDIAHTEKKALTKETLLSYLSHPVV